MLLRFTFLLLSSLSLGGMAARADQWFDAPSGYYTGVLKVTRVLGPEALTDAYTVRVKARVADDHTIAILVSTPQTPATASDVQSSVVRIRPTFSIPEDQVDFLVDEKYGGFGQYNRGVLRLTYENPRLSRFDPGTIVIPLGGTSTVAARSYTAFEFTLRKQPDPARKPPLVLIPVPAAK